MECRDYSTVSAEGKKGQHLGMAERGAIKALKQHGLGTRAITMGFYKPKGIIHLFSKTALIISAFNSDNPRLLSITAMNAGIEVGGIRVTPV